MSEEIREQQEYIIIVHMDTFCNALKNYLRLDRPGQYPEPLRFLHRRFYDRLGGGFFSF